MKRVALLGLVLVLVSTAIAAQPDDDIGYPTVQAALDAGDAIDSAICAHTKSEALRYWRKVFGTSFS